MPKKISTNATGATSQIATALKGVTPASTEKPKPSPKPQPTPAPKEAKPQRYEQIRPTLSASSQQGQIAMEQADKVNKAAGQKVMTAATVLKQFYSQYDEQIAKMLENHLKGS